MMATMSTKEDTSNALVALPTIAQPPLVVHTPSIVAVGDMVTILLQSNQMMIALQEQENAVSLLTNTLTLCGE